MLQTNSYHSLMSKLMHYAKNVTGTNAYWNQARDNLKAIINQNGPPTIFCTLSCADFHWPEFHGLFNNKIELSDSERRENVINNPHLLDWLFTERTEKFVKYWLYETLGATWHWFRYEYAVQRGSIHCHGVAKLKSDPGLCELSQQALAGYLIAESMTDTSLKKLSKEDLLKNQQLITKGKEAEKIICNYVDFLTSTENPCNPDDGNWVKPNIHPCKKKIEEIEKLKWDKDYEDLVNTVQRLTQCSTAYCLRKKDEQNNFFCRFNYPKDCCDQTHLEYEKIHSKDNKNHYTIRVVTKRNDSRLNNHQRLQLQGRRANCDIQVIIDYHSCLEYIAKYASKSEKMSSVAKDIFLSVLTEAPTDSDNKKIIKKLMMRAVGQRDMGIQEVMHQLLSIKLVSSSFQVISASLDGSRKIKVEGSSLTTEPSVVDLYAKRNMYESDFPGISALNFVQFASTFYKGRMGISKRSSTVVIRTYPNYSSNPDSTSYSLFCKYQLLKYKPWLFSFNNAWDNLEDRDSVYIETWRSFLETPEAKRLVPNWSVQLDSVSQFIGNDFDKSEDFQNEPGEREEWMYLAELKLKTDSNEGKQAIDLPNTYWENDRLKYTSQQMGDMPYWIDAQKKIFHPKNH